MRDLVGPRVVFSNPTRVERGVADQLLDAVHAHVTTRVTDRVTSRVCGYVGIRERRGMLIQPWFTVVRTFVGQALREDF